MKKLRFLFLSLFLIISLSDGQGQIIVNSYALQPTGDSQYPLTFGADLVHWTNTNNATGKTLSDDANTTLEGYTTQDAGARSFTLVNGANKHKFSGDFFYTDQINGYHTATKTDYKILHDGTTSWELWCDFTIVETSTTAVFKILHDNNAAISNPTTGQAGISIYYGNRSASSESHTLMIEMTRAVASQYLFRRFLHNAITPGQRTILRIQYNLATNTLTTWINGSQIDSVVRTAGTPSTADPGSNVAMGIGVGTGKAIFRHPVIVKKVLSAGEVSSLLDYYNFGNYSPGSAGIAYVIGVYGQSNCEGVGTSPSSHLLPALPVYIANASGAFQGKLDFPTNNAGAAGNQFGPELQGGYRCSVDHPNKVFLHKKGVSSTSMFGSSGAWNIGSTGSLGVAAVNSFIVLCNDIKYRFNLTPLPTAVWWRQGEADAHESNPDGASGAAFVESQYQTNYQALKDKFDTDVTAAGYSTASCEWIASLMNYSGVRPYNDNINNALTAVSDLVFSMNGQPMIDGTHFNGPGQEYQGDQFYVNTTF